MTQARTSSRAFTVIELLIVLGIIGVLAALLLPAFGRAREQARRAMCAGNQRQILMAMFMYADANRGVLPLPEAGLGFNFTHPPRETASIAIRMNAPGEYDWQRGQLWPYLGAPDALARRRIFNCPSDPDPRSTPTVISGNKRDHFVPRNFSYSFNYELYVSRDNFPASPIGVRLARVNHPDHKIFIVEEYDPLMEGCDLFAYMVLVNWLPHPLTTTRHGGYANIGMADGHVEQLSPADLPPSTMDLSAFQASTIHPSKYDYYCWLPR